MSKFCGNCGAQLDDSAKICGKCGTPLEGGNVAGLTYVDPEKKKKIMKKVKLGIIFVILIAVIVTGIKITSQFTGYNGQIRKIMAAYEKYDIDSLVSMSSDMYYYGDEDYVDYYFGYSVGNVLDSFESSVGHSYKLTYEVNEVYTLSGKKLDDMLKNISNSYSDFDVDIIQKIVVADLTVTAKQGGKSAKKNIRITLSKEEHSWRILYIE